MKNPTNEKRWKKTCSLCKKKHIVHRSPCPSCNLHDTIQPVSENVLCGGEICEGCEAYEEHYLPW